MGGLKYCEHGYLDGECDLAHEATDISYGKYKSSGIVSGVSEQ
jgi:hypothetical protein